MKRKKQIYGMVSMFLTAALVVSSLWMVPAAFAASRPTLNYKKLTMKKGASKTLKLKHAKKKVTWKTSNKKVVTVSKKGKLHAKKKGSAKITARSAGKKYVCKVTVKNATNLSGGSTSNPAVTPKVTSKPGTTAAPTPTPVSKSTLTASHSMPAAGATGVLTVGKIAVKLGMTKAQAVAAAGAAPDRIEKAPYQSAEVYVYNPSADYTNYLVLAFYQDKLVDMQTISPYFTYGSLLRAGDTATTLSSTGMTTSGVSAYYGAYDTGMAKLSTPVYKYTEDKTTIFAFTDYFGKKDTYGIQVFDSDFATLAQIIDQKNGTYDSSVYAAMKTETCEFLNAFRIYSGVVNGSGALVRDTTHDTVAQSISDEMPSGNGEPSTTSPKAKLLSAGYDDWTTCKMYSVSGKMEDAFAIANSYIECQTPRSYIKSDAKNSDGTKNAFLTTFGIGITYDLTKYSEMNSALVFTGTTDDD